MKTVKLSITKEMINGNEIQFDTVELLKVVINQQVQGGYSMEDMFSRLKLLGIIEKAGDKTKVDFEDADYEKLQRMVKEMRWGMVSKTIGDFIKSFGL